MAEVDSSWGQVIFPDVETKGKSILLIGGGPSTSEYNRWQEIETDYKLVTSEGYLNETIRKTIVDFYIINTRVDLTCEEFKEWYEINKDVRFVLEPKHLWKHPTGIELLSGRDDLCSIDIYKDYKVGMLPRVVIACILLGFSDIYVVGMDGFKKDGGGKHAFNGTSLKTLPNAALNTYQQYRDKFEVFVKDYKDIIGTEKYSNSRLHNLGYGHDANILTEFGIK